MKIGISGTATTVVTDANTAKAVKSGNLDVFSTPMMVALMEEAACKCLEEESVGTQISVMHSAASPLGASITATATVTGIEGRKVTFDLIAHDEKDGEKSEIGKGTHTRFIIDADRFMAKLKG